MWQTLLLSRWKTVFAWLPVETLIRGRQDAYYAVLGKSDSTASETPFIEFLLGTLRDALRDVARTDQVNAQVSVQVRSVLAALGDETLSSNELMARVGLVHRRTFRKTYLQPAIDLGLVEMTVPDKPNSRNQKYYAVKNALRIHLPSPLFPYSIGVSFCDMYFTFGTPLSSMVHRLNSINFLMQLISASPGSWKCASAPPMHILSNSLPKNVFFTPVNERSSSLHLAAQDLTLQLRM